MQQIFIDMTLLLYYDKFENLALKISSSSTLRWTWNKIFADGCNFKIIFKLFYRLIKLLLIESLVLPYFNNYQLLCHYQENFGHPKTITLIWFMIGANTLLRWLKLFKIIIEQNISLFSHNGRVSVKELEILIYNYLRIWKTSSFWTLTTILSINQRYIDLSFKAIAHGSKVFTSWSLARFKFLHVLIHISFHVLIGGLLALGQSVLV